MSPVSCTRCSAMVPADEVEYPYEGVDAYCGHWLFQAEQPIPRVKGRTVTPEGCPLREHESMFIGIAVRGGLSHEQYL